MQTSKEIANETCISLVFSPGWRYMTADNAIDKLRSLSISDIECSSLLNSEQKQELLQMRYLVAEDKIKERNTNEKRKPIPKTRKPSKGTRQFVTEGGSITTFDIK